MIILEWKFSNSRKFRNDLQLIKGDVVVIQEGNLLRILWRRG